MKEKYLLFTILKAIKIYYLKELQDLIFILEQETFILELVENILIHNYQHIIVLMEQVFIYIIHKIEGDTIM